MRQQPSHSARHLLLCFALLTLLPAVFAQNTPPAFEVASVRPAPPDTDPNTGSWSLPNVGRFTATHVSLEVLLKLAYGINGDQIVNKPGWLETNLYDLVARPEDGIKLSRDELKPRLRNLLQERFHLVAHTEARTTRGYILTVAKGGPHLSPTKAEHFPGWRSNVSPGQMRGVNWSMPQFARFLSEATGVPVADETGIIGNYDIAFSYDPSHEPSADIESSLPPLNDALQQATGLLLKPQKVSAEVLVIDSVDKTPTPN